ncbi:hypothetical protein K458DRAFT_390314 [Lentithecium fluviatile CBS 122367]|uniref:Uncharacterized protein n=1 Tax=Lentithecium fluviatile CBS 122367 TaxID=1168545 RepID=A0A6G1IXP6_9PLEO|nr:hypothetical protein K458DRAFT_390314 [Lentithecium fluviatile CBS 122367]
MTGRAWIPEGPGLGVQLAVTQTTARAALDEGADCSCDPTMQNQYGRASSIRSVKALPNQVEPSESFGRHVSCADMAAPGAVRESGPDGEASALGQMAKSPVD